MVLGLLPIANVVKIFLYSLLILLVLLTPIVFPARILLLISLIFLVKGVMDVVNKHYHRCYIYFFISFVLLLAFFNITPLILFVFLVLALALDIFL